MQSSRPTHEETFDAINDNLKEFERRLAKRKKINKKDYQKEITKLAELLSAYSREAFLAYDNILNINEVNSPISHQHMVNLGTQLTKLVAEDILTRDSIVGSALAFNRWSMVLGVLHKNHDFNSAQAVSTGLDNAVVTSLAKEFPANPEARERIDSWTKERITWSGHGYNTQMKYINAGRVIVPYLGDFKGKTVTFSERSAGLPTAKLVLNLAEVDDVLIEAQKLQMRSSKEKEYGSSSEGSDEKFKYEGNLLALFSQATLQNYEQIFSEINSIVDFIKDEEKQAQIRGQLNKLYKLITTDEEKTLTTNDEEKKFISKEERFNDFVGHATDLNKFREPVRDQQRKNTELRSKSVAKSKFYTSLLAPTDVDFSSIEKEVVLPRRMATLSKRVDENKYNFRKSEEKYKKLRSKREVPDYEEGQPVTPEMIIERRYYYSKKISNLLEELPPLDGLKSKKDAENYLAISKKILDVRDEWGKDENEKDKDVVIKHHLNKKKEAEKSTQDLRSNISLAGEMYSLFELLGETESLVRQKLSEFDNKKTSKVKSKNKKGKKKEKMTKIPAIPRIAMQNVPAFKSERKLKKPHTPQADKPASARNRSVTEGTPRVPQSPGRPSPRSPNLEARAKFFEQFHTTGESPTRGRSQTVESVGSPRKIGSEGQVPTSPLSKGSRISVRLPVKNDQAEENDKPALVSPRSHINRGVTPRTPKDQPVTPKGGSFIESSPAVISKGSRIRRAGTEKGSISSYSSDKLREDSEKLHKKEKKDKREKKKTHETSTVKLGESKINRMRAHTTLTDEKKRQEKEMSASPSFLRHTTVVRTTSGRALTGGNEVEKNQKKKRGSFIGTAFDSMRHKTRKDKEEKKKTPEFEKPPTPRSPRGRGGE